jgi:hypothetical protein
LLRCWRKKEKNYFSSCLNHHSNENETSSWKQIFALVTWKWDFWAFLFNIRELLRCSVRALVREGAQTLSPSLTRLSHFLLLCFTSIISNRCLYFNLIYIKMGLLTRHKKSSLFIIFGTVVLSRKLVFFFMKESAIIDIIQKYIKTYWHCS